MSTEAPPSLKDLEKEQSRVRKLLDELIGLGTNSMSIAMIKAALDLADRAVRRGTQKEVTKAYLVLSKFHK